LRVERTAAQGVRAAALQALTDDHRKTLVADARLRAKGTSYDYHDLLNGAYERWMASEKAVVGPAETCKYLRGAIRSMVFNERRHAKLVRRVDGVRVVAFEEEPDPMDAAPDPTASPEGALIMAQLYELCAHDPDVQMLLMFQDDGAERADVLRELGWDVTKYETVQKRKKKLVARLINEGKI
jgi:DNA-directed RNA polymerase specialized sigma24 family protein